VALDDEWGRKGLLSRRRRRFRQVSLQLHRQFQRPSTSGAMNLYLARRYLAPGLRPETPRGLGHLRRGPQHARAAGHPTRLLHQTTVLHKAPRHTSEHQFVAVARGQSGV
jgi:hypothetical protein